MGREQERAGQPPRGSWHRIAVDRGPAVSLNSSKFQKATKTDIQECLKHMQTPGFHGTLFEKPHAQEGQSPTPPATRSHQNRQLSSAHSRDPQGAEAEGHSL